jgi:hypothetical protein
MDALIAAYRDGLALAAVAVIGGSKGIRIAVLHDGEVRGGESVIARWWCRCTAEAECVADSAARSLRRLKEQSPDDRLRAAEAVIRAARRLAVTLRTDADLVEEATHAIARLDQEIEKQKQLGSLKSINQSYRRYRLEATSRGERVLPYAKWMDGYKVKLIREIAGNLRRM